MPCGGIYPVDDESGCFSPGSNAWCFHCGKKGPGPWSFVEEWDAHIHDSCIDEFLKGPEGEIVVSHGHDVVRRGDA